jgi:hypothetical protein
MDESSPKVPMPNNPSVKPALKHPTKAAASSMDTDDKEEKHLTWDEHAIEEHDVLRGTRMKVRLLLLCFRIQRDAILKVHIYPT